MNKINGVEIFRAGDWGSQGKFTEDDLDQIAAAYDPAVHEAPFTIGHPEDNKPAWGWIKRLYRKGVSLFADGEILDELADALARGIFKKRSAAIYKNFGTPGKLYLRHVALLGAMPPAIKGMADLTFAADAGDFTAFEFEEKNKEEATMPEPTEDKGKLIYSAEALNAIVAQEVLKKESELTAKFNEMSKERDNEIAKLTAELKTAQSKAEEFADAAAKVEIETFVEGLVKEGRVSPKMKPGVIGVLERAHKNDVELFAELKKNYSTADKVVEFSEATDAAGMSGGVGQKTDAKTDSLFKALGVTAEDVKKYDGAEFRLGN